MNIRKLQKGDEILLEEFLSDYAETSMFLRSNLRNSGLDYKDDCFHGEYIGSFADNEKINGVIAHYWNGNIMQQAVNDHVLDQLISSLRENISRPVAGIVGSSLLCESVISGLGLSNADFTLNRDEGLYALDLASLISPTKSENQSYRLIEARELERTILTQWFKAYEIEAFGMDDNAALDEHIENRVDETIKGTDTWVLVVNDQPVSLSGFNARLPDVVQVGPVWTPPTYRNKGFARTIVALTLQKAREENVQKAILFTDLPAAIKSYESIGFEEVDTYRLAILKEPLNIVF